MKKQCYVLSLILIISCYQHLEYSDPQFVYKEQRLKTFEHLMKFSGSPQLDTWKCPTNVWLKNSPKFVTSHPILIGMRQFNKNTVCNNKALGISGMIKPFVLYKQTQF